MYKFQLSGDFIKEWLPKTCLIGRNRLKLRMQEMKEVKSGIKFI